MTALDPLSQTNEWRFVSNHPVLFGMRIWPGGWVDTLIILGSGDVAIARRDKLGQRGQWSSTGSIEHIAREIVALGAPDGVTSRTTPKTPARPDDVPAGCSNQPEINS